MLCNNGPHMNLFLGDCKPSEVKAFTADYLDKVLEPCDWLAVWSTDVFSVLVEVSLVVSRHEERLRTAGLRNVVISSVTRCDDRDDIVERQQMVSFKSLKFFYYKKCCTLQSWLKSLNTDFTGPTSSLQRWTSNKHVKKEPTRLCVNQEQQLVVKGLNACCVWISEVCQLVMVARSSRPLISSSLTSSVHRICSSDGYFFSWRAYLCRCCRALSLVQLCSQTEVLTCVTRGCHWYFKSFDTPGSAAAVGIFRVIEMLRFHD